MNDNINRDWYNVNQTNERKMPSQAGMHAWVDQLTDETLRSELNPNAAPFISYPPSGCPQPFTSMSPFHNMSNMNTMNNMNNNTNPHHQYDNNNNMGHNNNFNHWDFTEALDESYSFLALNDLNDINDSNDFNVNSNDINEWTDEIDKQTIRTLLNEIYQEFHNDMGIDLQHIQNAMEMGIYNTLDALYCDLSDIWLNAKRLEKSVHFKISQIVSHQRLETLKAGKRNPTTDNPIHGATNQPRDYMYETNYDDDDATFADDPFAVLDDLIVNDNIKEFVNDDINSNSRSIHVADENVNDSVNHSINDDMDNEYINEAINEDINHDVLDSNIKDNAIVKDMHNDSRRDHDMDNEYDYSDESDIVYNTPNIFTKEEVDTLEVKHVEYDYNYNYNRNKHTKTQQKQQIKAKHKKKEIKMQKEIKYKKEEMKRQEIKKEQNKAQKPPIHSNNNNNNKNKHNNNNKAKAKPKQKHKSTKPKQIIGKKNKKDQSKHSHNNKAKHEQTQTKVKQITPKEHKKDKKDKNQKHHKNHKKEQKSKIKKNTNQNPQQKPKHNNSPAKPTKPPKHNHPQIKPIKPIQNNNKPSVNSKPVVNNSKSSVNNNNSKPIQNNNKPSVNNNNSKPNVNNKAGANKNKKPKKSKTERHKNKNKNRNNNKAKGKQKEPKKDVKKDVKNKNRNNNNNNKAKGNKNKGAKKGGKKSATPIANTKANNTKANNTKANNTMSRNDVLMAKSVGELKTILKNYMQEKDFVSFCEKRQFVSAIVTFETNIQERKKKWAEFRAKYPSINRNIICCNDNKYNEIHNLAEKEKNSGNEALTSAATYDVAIKHYTQSIKYQIDYKPSYMNRSLVYLKQKKYDKCITDCTIIIEMIKMVDGHMLQSNEMFKSYLRRGQAYKLQNKCFLAKNDLELALKIRPNDSSVNKLLSETKENCKKFELRKKLRSVESINDFNSVLSLSMELLQQATTSKNAMDDKECKESDELLRRLFAFLYKNKKCCMLFASKKGHILCLKYLQKKFASNINFSKENMGLIGKLYSLLNRCMAYIELSVQSLLALITDIIASTFKFFNKMHKMRELQTTAMRFVSLIVGNDSARNYVVRHCGESLIEYLSQFSFEIQKEPNKGLFESLSFLLRSSKFLYLLLRYSKSAYIYQLFFDCFCVYNDALKRRSYSKNNSKNKNTEKPLQFAISVLLDALTIIFDPALNGPFIILNESETNQMQISIKRMARHFISNKMTHSKYMRALKEYFSATHQMFLQSSSNVRRENEAVAYLSQTAKCMNVFSALSKVVSIDLLYKHEIHRELISLIGVCDKAESLAYYCNNFQMQSMVKLTRNSILTYFDHISDDKRFDSLFIEHFWQYIMCVFVAKPRVSKALQQFGHNKSCAIRCVYRWLHRCRGNTSTNRLLELIIFKYFHQMLDCLLIQDEQVLANAPLVLSECVKYILQQQKQKQPITLEKIKIIQFVKTSFTQKRIATIIKLMKTKHVAIQYNSMLLCAQISELDQQLQTICCTSGALKMVAQYDKVRKVKNVEILQNPLHFD